MRRLQFFDFCKDLSDALSFGCISLKEIYVHDGFKEKNIKVYLRAFKGFYPNDVSLIIDVFEKFSGRYGFRLKHRSSSFDLLSAEFIHISSF